jgi:hypothetical protein
MEILQLLALRSSCDSRPCGTLVNSINCQLPTISSLNSLSTEQQRHLFAASVAELNSQLPILSSQLAWGPRYIASGRTQQNTSVSTVPLLFWACLPIHCLETAVCWIAYCITTAVLVVCFEVSAQQRVYTPKYKERLVCLSKREQQWRELTQRILNVLSRTGSLRVTYKTGSGLED